MPRRFSLNQRSTNARRQAAIRAEESEEQRTQRNQTARERSARSRSRLREARNIDNQINTMQEINNSLKIWTPVEEMALIKFLKENIDFEKPRPQKFYERFLQNSGVNTDWKIVRSKAFNMRATYYKTKNWLDTIGETMTNNEAIENAIRNMCPFFYDFEEIFGSNVCTIVSNENDSGKRFFEFQNLSSHETTQPIDDTADKVSTTICNEACFRLAVSEVVQSQAEILKLKEEKLDFDTTFREQKLELLQRQVAIQEKQLDFKEKELKSQERIKKLELEMNERIAMKELELKYKN